MSMTVNYVRVPGDHIELLQKDLVEAWHDLNLNLNAYYRDTHPALDILLHELPGDVETLNMNDPAALAWLVSPLKREESRVTGPRVKRDSWPAIDLPLVAIEGRAVAIEGRDALRLPAVDFGLGQGAAFDPTTVQKLSRALSQITLDDLFRNFDYDTMQGMDLLGFGDKEEERATNERLARESFGHELRELQEFYQRAAASGQYVVVAFA